jgi:glycosyltransferase involved in cell wall biosynthesis
MMIDIIYMLYIVNPAGSVVELPSEELYEQLISQPMWRNPTDSEIAVFEHKRAALLYKIHRQATDASDIFYSTVSPNPDGYGMASRKLSEAMIEAGINFSEMQTGQPIGFLFNQPEPLATMPNPIKIIFTMFESTRIPGNWKPYLDLADLIIVPSHFCMEVFAREGYAATVVPLAYDTNVFTPVSHERLPPIQGNPFVFLHYDAFNMRKGFIELFNAFQKAFKPDEPVKLILKSRLNHLPLVPSEYPNVEVIDGATSDVKLAKLCQKADCFVFPSRGEGFGVPPLEAMGCGLPVIVPNAHGIAEYFNPDCMFEVKVEGPCPAVYEKHKDQDVGTMVKCDENDLARVMRYVYEHQNEVLDKGQKAAQYAKQYSYERVALNLKRIFDEYLARPHIPRPPVNVLPLELVE